MATKKDYELVAAVLKKEAERKLANFRNVDIGSVESEQHLGAVAEITIICIDLCAAFKLDNPNFDRVKFLKACGQEFCLSKAEVVSHEN